MQFLHMHFIHRKAYYPINNPHWWHCLTMLCIDVNRKALASTIIKCVVVYFDLTQLFLISLTVEKKNHILLWIYCRTLTHRTAFFLQIIFRFDSQKLTLYTYALAVTVLFWPATDLPNNSLKRTKNMKWTHKKNVSQTQTKIGERIETAKWNKHLAYRHDQKTRLDESEFHCVLFDRPFGRVCITATAGTVAAYSLFVDNDNMALTSSRLAHTNGLFLRFSRCSHFAFHSFDTWKHPHYRRSVDAILWTFVFWNLFSTLLNWKKIGFWTILQVKSWVSIDLKRNCWIWILKTRGGQICRKSSKNAKCVSFKTGYILNFFQMLKTKMWLSK